MLKLVYSLSDKAITLKFDTKKSFWTKEVVIALALSLALHALMYLAIQIKALDPKYEVIIPPSTVVTEIKPSRYLMDKVQVDHNGFIQTSVFSPQNFIAQLSSHEIRKPMTLKEDKKWSSNLNCFDTLEWKSELIEKPDLIVYKVIDPIQVDISDSLAERFIPLRVQPKRVLVGSTETLLCKFEIEVDNRSGAIFYGGLIQSCGYPKYDRYAENVLKNITFETSTEQFSSKGQVDIIIEADRCELYD